MLLLLLEDLFWWIISCIKINSVKWKEKYVSWYTRNYNKQFNIILPVEYLIHFDVKFKHQTPVNYGTYWWIVSKIYLIDNAPYQMRKISNENKLPLQNKLNMYFVSIVFLIVQKKCTVCQKKCFLKLHVLMSNYTMSSSSFH